MSHENDPCCNTNRVIVEGEKAQYQLLSINDANGKLSIIPNGNEISICPAVKSCETLTTIEEFRLIGDSVLELVYRGENGTPVSKIVDLSELEVEVVPFDIATSNTVELQLNGIELSAHVRIDPDSTANVTATSEGLRIDTSAESMLTTIDTDAIKLTAGGPTGHELTANLAVDDTDTIDLAITGSGLVGAVILSNDDRNLITIDNGLFVNSDDIVTLIGEGQEIQAEPPLEYDDVTNIISIPPADDLTDGYLTADAYIFFRDKVDSTRIINTNAPLAGGGDLSSDLTLSIVQANSTTSGYISVTDWLRFDSKLDPSRLINVTSPLVGGGSLASDITIGITAAASGVSGYLTGADWITFDAKAGTALNLGTGGGVFKQKNISKNLEFRSITGTPGQIVITQGADNVNIGIDPSFVTGDITATNLIVKDEAVNLTTSATSINFAGAGVTATTVSGDVTVTIPGPTSTIANVTYVDGTYTANIADADKVVFLKANTANLTYNISPATFSGRKIILFIQNTGSFFVTLTATSGTIIGNLNYIPSDNECITIYSDGSDLFSIAKN